MADKNTFEFNIDDKGKVIISEESVAIIAGQGALEVEGVECLYGKLSSDLLPKAGKSKISKAVRISEIEPNVLNVGISILINYGCEIPTVSKEVQERVKSIVESMTPLIVSRVDVHVATISDPD